MIKCIYSIAIREVTCVKYAFMALKGMFIGGTMLIPGVSGGTMAIILGVYQKLLYAVANIKKDFKNSILTLIPFALGGALGAVLLAYPIERLLLAFPLPVMYFFVGSVAGGVPLLLRKAFVGENKRAFRLKDVTAVILGIAVTIVFSVLPENILDVSGSSGIVAFIVFFIIGIVCSLTLMLPGISTSYMLLILGAIGTVYKAFETLDVSVLLPMVLGALFGMLLFSRIIESQLRLHPRTSFLTIFGFIIGSVIQLVIKPVVTFAPLSVRFVPQTLAALPTGLEWVICPALFAVAFISMFMISKGEK